LDLKNDGNTILQIEHNKEYIEETSDFIFVLEEKHLKVLKTAI
jgi:ABC-type Mn2+/Zn2+ transport system ATPase subunit